MQLLINILILKSLIFQGQSWTTVYRAKIKDSMKKHLIILISLLALALIGCSSTKKNMEEKPLATEEKSDASLGVHTDKARQLTA